MNALTFIKHPLKHADEETLVAAMERSMNAGDWKDGQKIVQLLGLKYGFTASLYRWRAHAYYQQQKYYMAVQEYSRSIMIDPNSSTAFYNRGFAFYRSGNHKAAWLDWKRAVELGDPDGDSAIAAHLPGFIVDTGGYTAGQMIWKRERSQMIALRIVLALAILFDVLFFIMHIESWNRFDLLPEGAFTEYDIKGWTVWCIIITGGRMWSCIQTWRKNDEDMYLMCSIALLLVGIFHVELLLTPLWLQLVLSVPFSLLLFYLARPLRYRLDMSWVSFNR